LEENGFYCLPTSIRITCLFFDVLQEFDYFGQLLCRCAVDVLFCFEICQRLFGSHKQQYKCLGYNNIPRQYFEVRSSRLFPLFIYTLPCINYGKYCSLQHENQRKLPKSCATSIPRIQKKKIKAHTPKD